MFPHFPHPQFQRPVRTLIAFMTAATETQLHESTDSWVPTFMGHYGPLQCCGRAAHVAKELKETGQRLLTMHRCTPHPCADTHIIWLRVENWGRSCLWWLSNLSFFDRQQQQHLGLAFARRCVNSLTVTCHHRKVKLHGSDIAICRLTPKYSQKSV